MGRVGGLRGACNLAARLNLGLDRREKVFEANLGGPLGEGAIGGLIEEAPHRRGRVKGGDAPTVRRRLAAQRPAKVYRTYAELTVGRCKARGPA